MNLHKNIIIVIVLTLPFSGCLTDSKLNLDFKSFTPQDIEDGLVLSTPSEENIDNAILTDVYEDVYIADNLWSLRSLLVFRNNKLVAEAYLKDQQDIYKKHLIWSCTKQVMGILVGIAEQEGLIDSLGEPIAKYLEAELVEHPDKAAITIRNLITMQSGIDYNNDGVKGQTDKILRQIPDSSVDFILDRGISFAPGTDFHYNDGDPHLMSAILQKQAGKSTDEWADDVLFSKLNLKNYNWVRYKDGITLGGFGIETTPRELAKLALCVANNGEWNNQQIIPEAWITDMTSTQVEIENSDYAFGYYWWIDKNKAIHFMWGHGGQFAFIVPQKNLVIIMTAIPNTQGDYQIQADEALPIVSRIIEAAY